MSETNIKTFKPIYRPMDNSDDIIKGDLHTEYREMIPKLLENPRSIAQFASTISSAIFSPVEPRMNLVIEDDGNRIFFTYKGRQFTDFGAIPTALVLVHYTDHTEYQVELLILSQDAPAKIVRVEMALLGSGRWIDKLGPEYVYEASAVGSLRIVLQHMAKFAPLKEEYCFSGWAPNGNFYMMNEQKLCGDSWMSEKAVIPCRHALQMLNVAPHMLTIPLLSVAMLSLVHSKMVSHGTYFKGVCCIAAPTQSFKTTLASLFFDFQSGTEANINFEATKVSIIRTIGNARDSTVIVDDYKPGSTTAEKNEMLKKLSTIIRMCSDNSGGIQKAGKDNSTVSNSADCMVLVTAEQIQINVQSTLARLLILTGDRKSVNIEKLTYFQENHHLYRDFIRGYISYIANTGVDRYCENLRQQFLQNRDVLRKALLDKDILVDNRTNDMCVWLYVTFKEFLNHALQTTAITKEQFDSYSEEAFHVFLTTMEQQAERVADLDDSKRFFKALQILLDTKEVHIRKLQPRNVGFVAEESKSAIGFQKRDYVYLKNDVAYQHVVAYYRRYGKEFVISETTLRKVFADNGFIDPKTEKSFIHRLSVNHESYQCIRFRKDKFYELLRGGKDHGEERYCEISGDRALLHNANNLLGGGTQID